MNSYKIALISICIMLASCQRDSDVTDSFPNYPDNNQVGISTSVKKEVKGMQTKFADEVSYTTYSGKTLGLSIDCLSDDGGSFDYTNVKWSTADDGATWHYESQMLWESAESENNIFAYAPYVDSYSSSSALTFAVKSDQSTEEKVTASDFATFNADDYVPGEDLTSGQSIPVVFNHKMVKLFITFNHGDEFTDDDFTNYTVSVKAKGEVTCDPSDGSVTATETAASFISPVVSEENNTAEVIIAPQTIAADAPFIELTINNTVYSFTMSSDYIFESGRPYSLKIKIGKDKIETTSVTVADWDADANVITGGKTEEYVVFMDAAFKTAVIEAMINKNSALSGITSIDVTNTDQLAALGAITRLDVSSKSINSLYGIEYLKGLKILYCSGNSLTKLDVSENTGLTYLDCNTNSLSELDVSGNIALEKLYCYSNNLTILKMPDDASLSRLTCYDNKLSELDVSENTGLTYLSCAVNSLTTLNLPDDAALTYLDCSFNSLGELNVSKNTGLINLYCANNSLDELNVSGSTALEKLSCNSNKLTELNVSGNKSLTTFYCYRNRLSSLDFSNTEVADYFLFCGNQTSDGSTSRQLTLKLTATQELYWENTKIIRENTTLAKNEYNGNVVVTND